MLLQFDPSGINPNNRVSDEVHTLTNSTAIYPLAGVFYTKELIVTGVSAANGSTVPLLIDIDFKLSPNFYKLSVSVGRGVYSYIVITNPSTWSSISISYNATGGSHIDTRLDATIKALGGFSKINPVVWNNINITPDPIYTNLADTKSAASRIADINLNYNLYRYTERINYQEHVNVNNDKAVTIADIDVAQNNSLSALLAATNDVPIALTVPTVNLSLIAGLDSSLASTVSSISNIATPIATNASNLSALDTLILGYTNSATSTINSNQPIIVNANNASSALTTKINAATAVDVIQDDNLVTVGLNKDNHATRLTTLGTLLSTNTANINAATLSYNGNTTNVSNISSKALTHASAIALNASRIVGLSSTNVTLQARVDAVLAVIQSNNQPILDNAAADLLQDPLIVGLRPRLNTQISNMTVDISAQNLNVANNNVAITALLNANSATKIRDIVQNNEISVQLTNINNIASQLGGIVPPILQLTADNATNIAALQVRLQ